METLESIERAHQRGLNKIFVRDKKIALKNINEVSKTGDLNKKDLKEALTLGLITKRDYHKYKKVAR